MQDAYWTTIGERPDLATLEVMNPEGFIGHQILPIMPSLDKSGYLFYRTVQADAAAQTSRNAGVAPTGTLISNSSTTYTAAEVMKRALVTPDEAKQMGGIEKADEVGAKWAKRQVLIKHENDIAYTLLGSAPSATFNANTFYTDVQAALDATRLYEGKKLLVGSTLTLRKLIKALVNDQTFGPQFVRMVSGSSPEVAITGLNFQTAYNALAEFLNVDAILRGSDDCWDASNSNGDISGRIALVKADDGTDPWSHKWKPVYGKCVHFLPDGKQEFVLRSAPNYIDVTNMYDAFVWYQAKELNAGAKYVFGSVV